MRRGDARLAPWLLVFASASIAECKRVLAAGIACRLRGGCRRFCSQSETCATPTGPPRRTTVPVSTCMTSYYQPTCQTTMGYRASYGTSPAPTGSGSRTCRGTSGGTRVQERAQALACRNRSRSQPLYHTTGDLDHFVNHHRVQTPSATPRTRGPNRLKILMDGR